MRLPALLSIVAVSWAVAAQEPQGPPDTLPAAATAVLASSLEASARHPNHVWRDTPPVNADGTVNAYVEIPRGDRRKWEFDMRANARAIDRMMPSDIGGYPVNYGYVPRTVSYDGDPFDVLVLGAPLPGGQVVRGVVVGLMFMEDEKGHDSKVVVSPPDAAGRPVHALTEPVRREIGDYFRRYKRHQPGAFSNVPGWGSVAQGRAYIDTTHAFFTQCQRRAGTACTITR